ncbi:alpha-2,3-sialyltransferase [Campylobacter coli]|nr:alpha-2,3-sialyltransferase [Campylobacter coli]EAJ7201399.1 alpha-2,3-sialyltransferase [Campylobacter coli]
MKKLAIQLFGHMRTYEKTYKKFKENIIDVNVQNNWEIDLFIHTWDKFNSSSKSWHKDLNLFSNNDYLKESDKNKIRKLYNPKILSIESLKEGEHGGLLSKRAGNKIREEYEKQNNIKYNYILYTRPDILFLNPLRLDRYLEEYNKYAFLKLPSKHAFCGNNFFRRMCIADPRYINEGDIVYFSSSSQECFRCEENKDFLVIPIDYTLHKDFFIQRANFIHGWRSHPLDQYEDKITLLQNQIKDKEFQVKKIQSELKDISYKKQQLEISNLEQDLINKKLQTKQLERQLGLVSNDAAVSHDNKITIIHPNSAKSRIQNQLSYKLGQAMIVNSKSLLGYIRMPFVLSYIKDKHKQEQKIYQEKIKKDPSLKLLPLESYPDYKEALKEKECFTYKLGEALIRANNNWYGGGYIKLLLEIRKLKREFYTKKDMR